MVKILDLPTLDSASLTGGTDFVVVTGPTITGGYGTGKVLLNTLSDYYNNTGALNSAGVSSLVDSNYIFNSINNSTTNSLTKPTIISWNNISNKPNSVAGTGVLDAMKTTDLNIVTASASGGGALEYNSVSTELTYTPPLITSNVDSSGDVTEGQNLFFTGARVVAIVDSAYVNARVDTGIDSAATISLVDSAYVLARSSAGLDSATITGSITDTKYLRSDELDNGHSLSLSHTFHAVGAITSDGDITAFNSASDRKLKENIKVIDNAVDKIASISGYTFNYIGREEKMSGVIADEVEAVLPEVVYEFDGEYKAVRYGNMMGLIIEAIKELKTDIDELKEKIK